MNFLTPKIWQQFWKKIFHKLLSIFLKKKLYRNQNFQFIVQNASINFRALCELVALRECDIKEDTIHICRAEIKNYTKDKNGKIVRDGYKVAQHPKTDAGIRTLVLTPDAKKYIKMVLDENKANGRSDKDYIFVSKSGERMHEYAVNNVLRRCNGVRNEKDRFVISGKPSGNHTIRKTCFSSRKRCNKKISYRQKKKSLVSQGFFLKG